MTYHEHVRALAEEMAPIIYKTKLFNIPWEDNANKEPWIKDAIPAALIAVGQRAEGARQIWALSYEWTDQQVSLRDHMKQCDQYLKEQGLIPDSAQESAGDGNIH